MSAGVAELWDAGEAVSGAAPGDGGGRYVEALRDEAGVVVGAVDLVVRTLTGFDLVTELLEPLAGDFGALDSMQQGWGQVAVALGAVAGNQSGLGDQLPAVWEGAAAAAAVTAIGDLAEVSGRQAEAASLVAEQLGHVLEVSLAAAELVCAGLRLIDDVVAGMLLRMAAGPAGLALNAAAAPYEATRIVLKVREVVRGLDRAVEVVGLCLEVVRRVKVVVDAAAVLAAGVATGGHARAGALTDDTAGAGFA